MRARSKGIPESVRYGAEAVRYQVWNADGSVFSDNTYTGTFPYPNKSDFQTMLDEPHPGYLKRIQRGELVLGPMDLSWKRVSCPGGFSVTGTRVPDGTGRYGIASGGGADNFTFRFFDQVLRPPPPPVLVTPSSGQLLLQALANVDPATTKHAEDFLQWRQTFSTFRKGPLAHMRDVVKQIRRDPISGAANAWLKYRNELVPTYGLVEDSVKNLISQSRVLERDVRLRASAVATDSYAVAKTLYESPAPYVGNYGDLIRTGDVRKRAVVYYKLRRASSGFTKAWGIRFKDLPVGFWNVVRFSYLIDRMYDVSSYLQAVSNLADPNVIYEGGVVTTCTKTLDSRQLLGYSQSPGNWVGSYAGKPWVVETKTIRRSIADSPASLISPSNIDFRPSGLVNDVTKATDVIALIIQGLSR